MERQTMTDDRLIVALDVKTLAEMKALVETLGDAVSFYKVGMELFYSVGEEAVTWLTSRGKSVFLDLKLYDIPNTVGEATAAVARLGATFLTVHASGGRRMLEAAVRRAKETAEAAGVSRTKILAVTVLTSFDEAGWQETGGQVPIAGEVLRLARLAKEAGADGVVASPEEAEMLRNELGDDFEIVTPGVRPAFASADDQRRTKIPADALAAGASRLVIGRPITRAADPAAAAKLILEEMKEI